MTDPGSVTLATGIDRDAADGESAGPNADFVRLFTQHQRSLYLYLLPLVSGPIDAEEVLQETNVVILSKWTQFQPGTNFGAWCRAIARLEVFRFRRQRHNRLHLMDDDVLEQLADHMDRHTSELDRKREALSDCVSKLRSEDRQLIDMRYAVGCSGDDVAEQLGRPANSIYQSLGRIRRTLLDCVRRKMTAAGGSV